MQFLAHPFLGDHANLIAGDFGRPAFYLNLQTRAPIRMQLAGDWTYHHRFQRAIQHVKTDDDRRPPLAHFAATDRVQIHPMYVVTAKVHSSRPPQRNPNRTSPPWPSPWPSQFPPRKASVASSASERFHFRVVRG